MLKKFLENEQYSFFIAKIAVIFQSLITVIVMVLLLLIFLDISFPKRVLLFVLCLDGLFVVVHLIYRRTYLGPKVVLRRHEKIILFFHVLSALGALTMTSLLIYYDSSLTVAFISTSFMLWMVSLVLGVLFFIQKYIDFKDS